MFDQSPLFTQVRKACALRRPTWKRGFLFACAFTLAVLVGACNDSEKSGSSLLQSFEGKGLAVAPLVAAAPATGLVFPSNGQTSGNIKFQFQGANVLSAYPATYIWRVNLRRQAGYYTTFYWAPAGQFTGANYYGAHPYPDGEPKTSSTAHKWDISIDGKNYVTDANRNSTQLGYDTWRIQAFRAYDNGVNKVHEFYWDLPDTTKVIRALLHRGYGSPAPSNPLLTFGDEPWNTGRARLSGILRGLQLYSATLTLPQILGEIENPLGTPAAQNIWYANLNPTPADISDKSGKGHNPVWVGSGRPTLWSGGEEVVKEGEQPVLPTIAFAANPASVSDGGSSVLTWSAANASSCNASGQWSGAKAISGSASTGPLYQAVTYTLTCSNAYGNTSRSVTVSRSGNPAPTVSLSANPAFIASGGSSTLTWSSANATSCEGSGAWNGSKATSGSASTGALNATNTFTLTCTGPGGSANQSATVTVTTTPPPPVPTVTLNANPSMVSTGGISMLTWSSANAAACAASGAWSGPKGVSGQASTGSLNASATFTLTCTGAGGSASQSAAVTVNPITGGQTGLVFPSNGQTNLDIKFKFTGSNLQPMYPATYVWRVNLRQQAGYYTTFFWTQDGPFVGTGFYGCHPYPDGEPKMQSRSHKWELSIDGRDFVNDANGHSTQLGYDVWRTQAFRAFDNGVNKVHEFYWDLPDTAKVIRVLLSRGYSTPQPAQAQLIWGDASWQIGEERLSGILRGMQLYAGNLNVSEILSEIASPLSTNTGRNNIWYLNLNPTPSDITDKSGKGHNPTWLSSARATLWTGP